MGKCLGRHSGRFVPPPSRLTRCRPILQWTRTDYISAHPPHISEGSLAQAEVHEEDWPWLVARLPSSPAKQTACYRQELNKLSYE